MRHLSDAAARKQAATNALHEQVSELNDSISLSDRVVDGTSSPTMGRINSHRSKDWFREAAEVLREAKQSGVDPTLIEHAKLKIKEKRRECNEQVQACEALQRTLSKKGVPTQEVLRNLQKVQHLQLQLAQ